jgi:hypothetical protein
MKRARTRLVVVLLTWVSFAVQAATLERLTMDDMVQKSTAIVRARVLSSAASFRGTPLGRSGMIYTHYTVQVLEQWKGEAASRMDVAVPGGFAQGVRQSFPGAPVLALNSEYVLFLWTSRSGLTQILGLSQGLMGLRPDTSGKMLVSRNASREPMVDAAGRAVPDSGFNMSLAEFRETMSRYGLTGVRK